MIRFNRSPLRLLPKAKAVLLPKRVYFKYQKGIAANIYMPGNIEIKTMSKIK